MKKRALRPDSYTYLILLRGLANYAHFPQSQARAMALYSAMEAPNSKVQPSLLHTNALLKVCARANDLDSMWAVAARMPEKGAHAADALTFTTILNAMRIQAVTQKAFGESAEDGIQRRETAILDARKIWKAIISRWHAADLGIDEDLVCAMGRLLLIGERPRDWDDVFSLVQQTMKIPRLQPALSGPTEVGPLRSSGEHCPSS